jgi:hypothetical protein
MGWVKIEIIKKIKKFKKKKILGILQKEIFYYSFKEALLVMSAKITHP